MKRIYILSLITTVLILGFSIQAKASLSNLNLDKISYQLIYDTGHGLTKYDYANADNMWRNHMDWISELDIDFENSTYDDWALNSTLDESPSDSQSQEWEFSIYIGQQLNFTEDVDVAAAVVSKPISSTINMKTLRFAFYKAF